MGSEYMGPLPDPNAPRRRPVPSERYTAPYTAENSTSVEDEDTHPRPAVRPSQAAPSYRGEQPQEPIYREHVSGMLLVPPSEAPRFYPAYNPYAVPVPAQRQPAQRPDYQHGTDQPYSQPPQYQHPPAYAGRQQGYPGSVGYPGYGGQPYYAPNGYHGPAQPYGPYWQQGYYPGYYGYPYYGYYYGYPYYPWQPLRPARSAYELTISIIAFIGSILALLAGAGNVLILLLLTALPRTQGLSAGQAFAGIIEFTAFAAAGLIGGGFGLYHSIRALFFRKPSAAFKLPWFWIFLLLYLVVIAVGLWMRYAGLAIANAPLTILLIALAGVFPALTIMSLGVRRVHFPRNAPWPTTWRRFALALTSGATLAILLALVFELVLSIIVARQFGVTNISLDNPDQQIPNDPKLIGFLFVLVSVIAPFVEETVKPLAVVALIGRIRSAAEAFILGLACGIGFDLVETAGYMGMGYKDWVDVAIQRSTAGLLHGFGAGMVALGWYFITHTHSTRRVNRVLLAFGCWCYALLQHALWNGSFGLQLLPAPVGPYLDKGTITLGPVRFGSFTLVYVVASALMLAFFLFVTKKLRSKATPPSPQSTQGATQPLTRKPQIAVRA